MVWAADVDHKVAGLDGRGGALRGPPQMRPHAGQQFLNAEGLGYIVVGAGVERLHLRSLVVADGKNQHRRCALRANGAAHLDSAHRRHHQVGDHQVGRPFAEDAQALFRIVRGAHVEGLR